MYNSDEESIETTALGLLSQTEVLAFTAKWSGPYFVNTLTDFKEVLSDAVLTVGVQESLSSIVGARAEGR